MYEMLLKNTSGGGYIPPNILIMGITGSTSVRTMNFSCRRVNGSFTFDVPGTIPFSIGDTLTTVPVSIPANAREIHIKIEVTSTGISIPLLGTPLAGNSIITDVFGWGRMDSRLNVRFQGCAALVGMPKTAPTWNNWDSMFINSSQFNGDLSHWDTSHVTDMSNMFSGNRDFNGWINDWDVGNVTSMRRMFLGNRVFNQPVSNWNTGRVTDISDFIGGVNSPSVFNQSIANWNVANVVDMRRLFNNCINYDRDLSSMTFPKVTPAMRLNYDLDTPAWTANRKPTFAL